MRVLSLVLAAAFVATAMLPLVSATLPPCTCDPLPRCLALSDGSSPPPPGCPTVTVPSVPPVPSLPDLRDLDPRNWPCTCDPMPEPLDLSKVIA
jgi:hypothetical protein